MTAPSDPNDLPLWRAAERAERSAGTGRLLLWPAWKDRRLVERLADAFLCLPAGEDVEDFRARHFVPLADSRRAAGFSEPAIAHELVWLEDAVTRALGVQGEHDETGGLVA